MRILANLNVVGTLDLDNVANAAADTDRFLVQDANGVVKYRTGAEVASDIGAAIGYVSTVKHEVKLAVAVGKGKAVYVSGSDGTNMLASLASNASEATSTKTLGLTESAGAQNAKVFVVSEGLLAGLDTSTATIGDPVWLGVDGELVYGLNNKPYAPAHMVFVGLVTRVNQNNGEIFVKVQNGFELQELHNVQITTTPANNTVLSYETSSSLYKMKSIATLLGYTPADDAGVVHLAGTETISGTKTFTAATTTFAKVVANAPFGGATGEGIVVGKSFKLDASGEGESAKIYVVTKDLSDTYGSGLQIQFANIEDTKGFGFNLNTAGGYELYTKDAGAAWVKAMTISNAQLATFHGNVRLANYTTNGFVKTSSSNGTITIDPAAFTLTTTGTNGPATYNSGTGVLNIPEYLGASGIRIVYNFTATAGQTTFTVTSYTPGVIDVFYNGSRLNEDEYTATNGTTIVLDTACAVGDLVDIIVYQGSINGFTGVGGSGTINQLTYWTGANTIGALSTATYPSLTEISYVKGVTSAIQTQLDAKVPTSRTLTINGTSYDLSANRSWTISGVTGSGTANQVAYWDGSSSVAGSTFLTLNLTADNGYLILTGGATYKNADIWLNRHSDAWENAIRFQTNGTTDWYLGSSATGSNSNLELFSYGTSSAALTLLRSNANANFGASVGIGNTTLTGYSLRVSRTMVGDTASGITSFGVVSDGTVQAAVTSGAFGFNSSLSTAAAEFTLDSLIHFRATQGTIGSTSAVTSQYGFAALGTMTGATNNYGFFGSLDSATGRWNLYMSGTARNYLAGDTSIGTTTGGYKLNVSGTANISGVLTGTTGTFSSTLTGTGLRSFAVNSAQTPNNNAGWYTLARFNTYSPYLNTNGNSGIITLTFYGGGLYTPSRFRIFYFKDDANIATLKLEKYGAVDYIQEVRIRYRTGDTRYYIEIYCDSHPSGLTFDIHHDRLLGYGDQLELFGGVLDAVSGTGTILSNLSFVDHGTTVSNLRVESASSFTSSVTASSFVKSGGLTTQFLKADGTVDGTTYQAALTNPVTGTGTLNYLSKFTATGSTIGSSLVYDNGSTVFIGTTTTSTQYTAEEFVVSGGSYTNVEFRGTSQAALALTKGTNSTASSPAVEIFNSGNFGIVAYRPTVVSSNYIIYYALESSTNRSLAFQTEGYDRLTLNQAGTVRLNYYTTNGFVKFSGSDGTLVVDTNTYLTSYTETDTLASVTGRGASTTSSLSFNAVAATDGTGDWTNASTFTYKISPASSYWRIIHLSAHASVSGVYTYQTGKSVYWGEDTDTGDYSFRGRTLKSGSNVVLHAGNYSSYALPLSGGTLTGALSGTDATFNSSFTALSNNGTYQVARSFGISGVDYRHKYILLARVPTFGNQSINCAFRGRITSDRVNELGMNVDQDISLSIGYGNSVYWSTNSRANNKYTLVTYNHNGTNYLALYQYTAPNYYQGTFTGMVSNFGGWLDANFLTVVELASANHSNASYGQYDQSIMGNTTLHAGNYNSYALPLTGGTMTGDIQMGNNQNRVIKFRTASAWDYSLKGINDDFFITDNPGLNYVACYYNGGDNNRYLSLVGGFNVFASGKMSFTSSNYMTGSPTHGFRFNSANDAFNNVIMRDNGNVEVRGSMIVGAVSSTPQGKLQVVGDMRWSSGGNSYYTYSDMDGGGLYIETVDNNTSRAKMRFQTRVNNSGNYIQYQLDANNSRFYWEGGGSAKATLSSSTGTFTVSGDVVAYGSPSDNRLKTIKSKVSNAVEKVSKLNGYYFDWNEVSDLAKIKEDVGVIAQEVADVFPELARTNDDGFMSVRYQGLTAVLIEAVKELAAENKQIKEELNKLKN